MVSANLDGGGRAARRLRAAALAFRIDPATLRAMQSHQYRTAREDLEELHAIALRLHGPQARSTRRIAAALQDELRSAAAVRGDARPQPQPQPRAAAPERRESALQ